MWAELHGSLRADVGSFVNDSNAVIKNGSNAANKNDANTAIKDYGNDAIKDYGNIAIKERSSAAVLYRWLRWQGLDRDAGPDAIGAVTNVGMMALEQET